MIRILLPFAKGGGWTDRHTDKQTDKRTLRAIDRLNWPYVNPPDPPTPLTQTHTLNPKSTLYQCVLEHMMSVEGLKVFLLCKERGSIKVETFWREQQG